MNNFPNFSSKAFQVFLNTYWPHHEHFNSGIHKVFEKDVDHLCSGSCEVKFLFLDKAYSAGLRRWFKRCSEGEMLSGCSAVNEWEDCGCDPVSVFIRHLELHKKQSRFRSLMQHSRDIGHTLRSENLEEVLNIQEEFGDLLEARIRPAKNRDEAVNFQSFCSKYLWFHAGIFPVYDRLAKDGLRYLQRRGAPKYADYREYAPDIFLLLQSIFPECEEFTPAQIKQVDGFLVWIGADRSRMCP